MSEYIDKQSRLFSLWFSVPIEPLIDIFTEMDRNNPGQISGLALLSATATDIKNMLDEGTISTKNLIISSLNLINSHNKNGMNLNALIDVAPESKLIEWAEELDKERSSGNSRGPFHGVTIVLKVRSMGV